MKILTKTVALSLLAVAIGIMPAAGQSMGSTPKAGTEATDSPDIVMRVDGLACPFCAHGLEKKLDALDATDRVVVKLNDGEVFLFLKPGGTVNDDILTGAVRDAGFVVREIRRRTDASG